MRWIALENGLRLEGQPYFNKEQFEDLIQQLQSTNKKSQTVCTELQKDVGRGHVRKEVIFQLSKWCDWNQRRAEAIARKIGDLLFGIYPQPRFLDQQDKPLPNADFHYREWAQKVVNGQLPFIPENPEVLSLQSDPNLKDLIQHFRQVILYGPPGTGKTRLARQEAIRLLKGDSLPTTHTVDVEELFTTFRKENRFELVVFHPAYEYEQFVGGIEPMVVGGNLCFQVKAGVFLRLCRWAEEHNRIVVLLIDEINRGNLPKLLGELVYALEYRGSSVALPFIHNGRSDLVIPKSLYIIATMNSSDRSIGHIDVAIRRRFGLYQVPPDPEVIKKEWTEAQDAPHGERLAQLMLRLNSAIAGGDIEAELGVGHSYFIPDPYSPLPAKLQVEMKWTHQVYPLLREYAQVLNLEKEFFRKFPPTLGAAVA
jgi:DNA polymerase III delta prime subunit